ncbi:hypothetical protein Tco_0094851, partial [Tanacetum coccineum]
TELVEGKEKREGEELIQKSSKKQKVDDEEIALKFKEAKGGSLLICLFPVST